MVMPFPVKKTEITDLYFVAENVGKLKKLEYLNVALNNIERIENLEGQILNKTFCLFTLKHALLWLSVKEGGSRSICPLVKVLC